MPLILGANSASGGYNVANSLRFNSASSDYLSRTPSSTGDRQKFTISCWVKRSTLTASGKNIMVAWSGAKSGASFGSAIYFNSSDQIEVDHDIAGSDYTFNTNMVFRDVSAWYHIVLAVDTTQATSANRQTIYVNGSSVALTATALGFPIQNFNTYFNFSGGENDIGSDYFSAGYADQYMSEFYLIDGQALTPSSFGETDFDTGIWKPKAYTGTYGTNGFYLQFKNSASLGTDSSGNGNTFTVNNLTSVDQSTDTPTNNFCTLNAVQTPTYATLSEGNLVTAGSDYTGCSANFGVNKGKWYWEVKTVGTTGINQYTGVSNRANEQSGDSSPNLATANVRSWAGNGQFKNYTGTVGVSNASFISTNGTIYSYALDLDNGTLARYVNGSLINTDTTLPSDNSVTFFPFTNTTNSGGGGWNQSQFNFGSPMYSANSYTDGAGYGNFSYAVPSGYYSLNTKNLATFG
jgi:hypothetical protein